MTLIVGATQYLNAATLANKLGTAPSLPTLLSQNTTVASILQASRSTLSVKGLGVSASARALNEDFLNRSGDINAMFSLGIGPAATLDGLAQEILALRASLPDDKLALSLRGQVVDTVDEDGNKIPPSQQLLGREVDEEA